jgi:formylglycine-generating enzyme required for sulfatase activity
MARIFISYARKYESFARRLATALSNVGANVWLDVNDIPSGMNWSSAIQEGLDLGDLMLLILTPEAMASENVAHEWQYYLDDGKPILPILLKPTRVHFQIRRLQYVDFYEQDFETAFAQLHSELRRQGLKLKPLSQDDASVALPKNPTLPEQQDNPRPAWLPYVAVLAIVAVIVVGIALLSGGDTVGTEPALSETPPTTLVAQGGGDSDTTDDVGTAFLPSETPEPTQTPTSIPTDSDTPIPPAEATLTAIANERAIVQATDTIIAQQNAQATQAFLAPTQTQDALDAVATEVALTLNAIDTATAQASNTPTPTNTPLPTLSPLEEALQRARNFTGTQNSDWQPFEADFDGVTMVLVPVGCFMMGESGSGGRQCFDTPFWIDRTEVSREQFDACVEAGPCNPRSPTIYSSDENQPITNTNWTAAAFYCSWRNARLPWESEWEFAARGPDNLPYPWGDEWVNDYVVDSANSNNRTAPVDSYAVGASWVGALHMLGNAWEWMRDIYNVYPYEPLIEGRMWLDPMTLRGGSFTLPGPYASTLRTAYDPYSQDISFGFRCVRPVE